MPSTERTTRVNMQLFVRDLLAQRPPMAWESYQNGAGSLVMDDGAGIRVAHTGDPSSLRMLLSGGLEQLGPPDPPEPEPEELPAERHDV